MSFSSTWFSTSLNWRILLFTFRRSTAPYTRLPRRLNFRNNNGFFSFRTSLSNQADFASNINFATGEPYHVIIQQFNVNGQYHYKIIMNDEVKEDKVNNNPQSWSNVNLYTSDSFETSFTSEFGSICNFTVHPQTALLYQCPNLTGFTFYLQKCQIIYSSANCFFV